MLLTACCRDTRPKGRRKVESGKWKVEGGSEQVAGAFGSRPLTNTRVFPVQAGSKSVFFS